MRSRAGRVTAAMVLATALTSCGDTGTGLPDGDELRLEIVTGDGQQGVPGWTLRDPLIVRVTDDTGTPVANARMTIRAAGGGYTSTSASVSSGLGLASTSWTLGPASVREQSVTVKLNDSEASVTFSGIALGPDESDMVIVHGALGDMKGLVLTTMGANLGVLGMQRTSDTIYYLPPDSPSGTSFVLFGKANRPYMDSAVRTSGVDTIHVSLEPPVAVDIDFHVRTGSFEAHKSIMLEQLANTEAVWSEEGAGIVLGEVDFEDDTDPVRTVEKSSAGICSNLTLRDAVQIDVVTSIDGGSFTGWGCWAGQIYMANGTERFPNLLAHELGHTFTLEHTPTGLMFPNQPGTVMREGEIFRAHFHSQSVLNTIFASQPEANRRTCNARPSPCLPETLDLTTGVIAQRALRPSLLDAVRFGPPVDGVEVGRRGRH